MPSAAPDLADFVALLFAAFSRAGVKDEQREYNEERGILVLHPTEDGGALRVVPVLALAVQYAACADGVARSAFLDAATDAFALGRSDAPSEWGECAGRLLPQLWPLEKIVARAVTLPSGVELPHCGLHGEEPPLTFANTGHDIGVVLVYEYVGAGSAMPPLETPVLSRDLTRWDVSFTSALARALENLRSRTKAGIASEKRWEHHQSGCGQSGWHDRFDAARAALLPRLVATRKRADGIAEQGGHVVAFATSSMVVATTSRNALGLCYLGDTLYLKVAGSGEQATAEQLLSRTPYRLLKMRDSRSGGGGGGGAKSSSAEPGADGNPAEHPLNRASSAGEGFVWRWTPYSPGGPPLRTAGEFSVPIDSGEVDAILNAIEGGRPVPVFTHGEASGATAMPSTSSRFADLKEVANAHFKAGRYIEAIKGYNAALEVPPPSDADAAIINANAAQALLNLAALDDPRKEGCAAEALRRATAAAELDPTNLKAHLRCAAACEILNEPAAAAEFKAKANGVAAAEAATKAVRKEQEEDKRRADAASKEAFEKDAAAKAARKELLEKEQAQEREKEQAAAKIATAATV
eukprot:NODE_3561_length_2018_cov_15.497091.p1 GENE.NODE_3561_length_2018_cov_15.497091~~NODE_3561_length_2018_cov_15.497091.p1  ORF type:complete len:581 (+),score=191.37 NODE_3561_length_2018_cov_15.497091:82-1824(+)